VRRALRQSGGRFVISEDQSRELRFFSRTGEHERTVGRPGSGPGEFQIIHDLGLFGGDSLFVWDSRLRRATVLSPEGDVARLVSLAPPPVDTRHARPGSKPCTRSRAAG